MGERWAARKKVIRGKLGLDDQDGLSVEDEDFNMDVLLLIPLEVQ